MPDATLADVAVSETDSCGCCIKPPTSPRDLIRELEERHDRVSRQLRQLESNLALSVSP